MGDGREKLEQFVDGLVRDQPPRRAPASLQARVLAQIAARQSAMPWWRRGFTHWPLAARATFLLAAVGFIELALVGVESVAEFVRSRDVAGIAMLQKTGDVISVTASTASLVLHAIPSIWLYGAAAFAVALYVLVFGLGAFAYRTLYVQR